MDVRKAFLYFDPRVFVLLVRLSTNAVLCVKVQPHDVDSDKADSDVTFVETAMVVAMSGSVTPEPEY